MSAAAGADTPVRVLLMSGAMEGGGSEHQTLLLLRHLDRRLYAPELYLTHRRGELLGEIPADVPIHAFDDNPPANRLNWPGRIHRQIVRHLRRVIAERHIDVVYDRTFHMTLVAGPATRNTTGRISTIVSPPDRDLPQSETRFRSIKRRQLARAYRQSHAVLAVSDAVRRSAIRYYGLPPESVHTLRSPLDLSHLRCIAATDPGVTLDPAAAHLACVGRMTREKGQDLLIDALSQTNLPGLKTILWMVGDGPLRENLQRQANSLGMADRIRFTGHLPHAARLIARCDALVCPSRYEGLPNVVLEAFGLGKPVIATDTGGIGEVVRDGRTGYLVRPDDAGALAEGITRWATASPSKRQATVAEAARLVEHECDLASHLQRLQQWLLSAARRTPSNHVLRHS